MAPEQDGQESGKPLRSLAMRFKAWAGLYEAGRGLRMYSPEETQRAVIQPGAHRRSRLKTNRDRVKPEVAGPAFGKSPVQALASGSSRIFLRHSAGPVSWTFSPEASTATVTGISSTVNSKIASMPKSSNAMHREARIALETR